MNINYEIIPKVLDFKPVFNAKHSYVNALLYQKFRIDLGLWVHFAIFAFSQSIISLYYAVFRKRLLKRKILLDIAFVFQVSGMICALIANIVWSEGCLDYLYLKPLFVFDLKDVYINCFVILFLIYTFSNQEPLKELKKKDFVDYVKSLLFKNYTI